MTNTMKNIRALAFLMEQNHNVKCLFFPVSERCQITLKQNRPQKMPIGNFSLDTFVC